MLVGLPRELGCGSEVVFKHYFSIQMFGYLLVLSC